MFTFKVTSVALATLMLVGAGAECLAKPCQACKVYCYCAPSEAATAQSAAPSQYRRYSYTPGQRYSYAPSGSEYGSGRYNQGPALGTGSDYRPGPEYSPQQGINSAEFKIRGL